MVPFIKTVTLYEIMMMIDTLLSITPSVTSPISLRIARESGSPYLAPDLGLSPQNSLYGKKDFLKEVVSRKRNMSVGNTLRAITRTTNYCIIDIYQVLHLLLKPGHRFLGANSKHKSVHVLFIKSHFDLLQKDKVGKTMIVTEISVFCLPLDRLIAI